MTKLSREVILKLKNLTDIIAETYKSLKDEQNKKKIAEEQCYFLSEQIKSFAKDLKVNNISLVTSLFKRNINVKVCLLFKQFVLFFVF